MASDGPRTGASDLGLEADARLEAELRVKFKPDCSPAQYHVNVYHRVLVDDCEHRTEAETKDMARGLNAAAQRAASSICELNDNCNTAVLVDRTVTRNECRGRVWEVDARYTFECVASN